MLVLSRHFNQSVMIGDEIEVKIVEIRGDKVRLGFSAPQGVPIHRREVYEAIQRGEPGRFAKPDASTTTAVSAEVKP